MSRILDLKGHIQAFQEIISLLTRHRQLTVEMAKREISDRYMGQVFGTFWAYGHPIVMMGVYLFIFAYVFKVKIDGTHIVSLGYPAYLLSGLIPWLSFQESIAKGTTVIVNNANLVKQVVFPIEILPVKGIIASLVTMLVSLFLFIVYVFVSQHSLPWTYILLPFLIFLQTLAMIGVCYILSSVGVFFRDLKDFVQVFSMIGVYLMPVFYLPESVPELFRPLLYLNPFSYLVWCYQDALYFGSFEHGWVWFIFPIMSISAFYIGYRVFKKLKIMFGNVL